MDILYEDAQIVVCVKPVGQDAEQAVPALLQAQLGGAAPLCVHRLDKAVGGVMVYARTKAAAGRLQAAFSGHETEKTYLAVVKGVPDPPEATLTDLLYHDARANKTFVVQRQRRGVKEARLDYRLLETARALSLVHITLHTGRSHLIRVQFASRQLPLWGDSRYGGGPGSPALWAWRLTFPHPVTGQALTFSAPPPDREPWQVFSTLKEF